MRSVRSLRLCSNKDALQQRSKEEELSLDHLRQHAFTNSRQYHDRSAMVGAKGLEMADAIVIADTINKLAESLKGMGESSDRDDDMMAEVQSALERASKTLQSVSSSGTKPEAETIIATLPLTKGVTFYDGMAPPRSPQKSSNIRTPRRSNVTLAAHAVQQQQQIAAITGCPSPQRLLQSASAALSCSSGYLATIGELSPPPSPPGIIELMDDPPTPKFKNRRNKSKKLSLDFEDFAGDNKGKKNIQITKGDIDIRIWGPSVGGLTLTTEGTSSSGENDSPINTPITSWVVSGERNKSQEQMATSKQPHAGTRNQAQFDGRRSQSLEKPRFPWQTKHLEKRERVGERGAASNNRSDPDGVSSAAAIKNLENLVLEAMNAHRTQEEAPPTRILRNKKFSKARTKVSEDAAPNRPEKHHHDLHPAMSHLSYVSGRLPNQTSGEEKFKTVQTDHEKGFEVFLESSEPSSSPSRYNSTKLRERAALSEKLLSKRREILSIQQDLEACSQLLGTFGNKSTLRTTNLASIDKQKRIAPASGTKKKVANAAIIRE